MKTNRIVMYVGVIFVLFVLYYSCTRQIRIEIRHLKEGEGVVYFTDFSTNIQIPFVFVTNLSTSPEKDYAVWVIHTKCRDDSTGKVLIRTNFFYLDRFLTGNLFPQFHQITSITNQKVSYYFLEK